MDDTNSRAMDAVGAATRKRRSSILKSQRPPRTPFSELEFNVATPTDTTKSRRVSFSKRTGVAEFATNEATTTWKNFYEEQNKYMELSGNDSGPNDQRAVVSVGRKIFDQQFEEVEAVDFITTMNNRNGLNINNSMQNVNFAPLEMTGITLDKLTVPENKFELSTFTDHQSKVFSDNMTVTNMEVTGGININFSNVQPLSEKDDLDEIEKDIGRVHSDVVCHGPFNMRDMSGYIEVDLNTTHIVMRDEESDMSITDSVHIPKVQDVSKNISVDKKDTNKDWVVDKENIAINPYVAPRESDNFDINEESHKILVFDGKGLTIQSENIISNTKSVVPNVPKENKTKTITLNLNADLPNFFEETKSNNKNVSCVQTREVNESKSRTLLHDDGMDISMTQALPVNILVSDVVKEEKQNTIVFGTNTGNMSITQVAPKSTNLFENDANISLTEVISAKVLLNKTASEDKNTTKVSSNGQIDGVQRRKTILYESDGDISITQAVPANIVLMNSKEERRQTIVFEDDGNMSMTQAIPTNILQERNEKLNKNNSVSEEVNCFPSASKNNKRQTMVFDNDEGNMSVTQALPTNILNAEMVSTSNIINKSKLEMAYDVENNHNITKSVAPSAKVIVGNGYSEKLANSNISIGQNITPNIAENIKYVKHGIVNIHSNIIPEVHFNEILIKENRRNTIHYENDGDMSVTQAVPVNIIKNEDTYSAVKNERNEDKEALSAKNICEITKLVENQKNYPNKTVKIGETNITKSNLIQKIVDISVTNNRANSSDLEGDVSMKKSTKGNEFQIDMRKIQNILGETGKCGETPNQDVERSYGTHDINLNQSHKKLIKIVEVITDDSSKTTSNPIPMEVSVVCDEMVKSKEIKVDTTLENVHQNVLVYQSFTTSCTQLQIKRTEQGDIKSDRTLNQCDEKPESSTTLKAGVNSEEILIDVHKEPSEDKISTTTFSKESADVEINVEKPISILDELLDMSTASVEGLDEKYCTVKVESPDASVEILNNPTPDKTSNESMFYITRDCDQDLQAEVQNKSLKEDGKPKIETSPLPLEFKEDQPQIANVLQNKLKSIRTVLNGSNSSPTENRRYEKVVSSDMSMENEKVKERLSMAGRSFKTADDTRDLLKLLSEYTEQESDYIVDNEAPKPITVKGHIAIENKTEIAPTRLSLAPNRLSIAISREDLLRNISTAQATLQQSCFEFDESDSIEETDQSLEQSSHKKSVRISSEVVKTLHFEDETASDVSSKSEMKMSPLKKTAFGETSYMKESKANVIPSYLKDVSDNIKALMNDLVKPVQDAMPFEAGKSDKGVRGSNSTCSTQVQANLITSSQIDIESEINSERQSPRQMDSADTLIGGIADLGNRAVVHALKSALKSRPVERYSEVEEMSADESFKELCSGRLPSGQYIPDKVLVFDHSNPLNNVLLAPPDFADVHRYNPRMSTETLCVSERSDSAQISVHGCENVGQGPTRYLVETAIVNQAGDTCTEKSAEIQSVSSNISKPMSVDESTDVEPLAVKDTEVNTVIAMKGVKQLLEASSSLTLVDDALAQPVSDVIDTNASSQDDVSSKDLNPVTTIYQTEDVNKLESDITSNDEEPVKSRTKKRVYSPAKFHGPTNCTLSGLDSQHKPVSKMQKISDSPCSVRNKEVDFVEIDDEPVKESKVEQKQKSPKKSKKPGTSVMVQRLLTEYKLEGDSAEVKSQSTIPHTVSQSDVDRPSVDVISSFTSSKNLRAHSVSDTASRTASTASDSRASRLEWRSDLTDDRSRNAIPESDSSVNVVAKIDMLPFMGSAHCEWEASAGDTWSFRLLHALLRLEVRLQHRHRNASRTRVAADTPLLACAVNAVAHDKCVYKRDPVSGACVRFALEAMRCLAAGAERAADVPALLRRCCAVARLALRWGRAMHDARARLAYTLDEKGVLTLKVANIGLRSVWEVTTRLELVLDEGERAPWPRAGHVRVARVVSDYKISDEEVCRALANVPADWGHVPRTLWRIFKYLKHKTRGDDFLGV